MTPEMFPHAWIMFVIIIALVASVVAGKLGPDSFSFISRINMGVETNVWFIYS